jgi:hypothetical protein
MNVQWNMEFVSGAVAESVRGIPPGEYTIYGRVTEVAATDDGDYSVTYLVESVNER